MSSIVCRFFCSRVRRHFSPFWDEAASVVLVGRLAVFVIPGTAMWTLLPLIANRQLGLGASGYGLLFAFLGLGAVAAALATFLPCYLFTVLPAPYFKKYGKKPGIVAFVDGVTAAAIGSLAGAVVVIGVRSIKDVPTALLALGTAALLWKFKKLPEPIVVAAAALIGLVVYPLVTRS